MIVPLVALSTLLVSPAWVAEQQAARAPLVILHVGDRAGYDAGHMPGAQFIALRELSDPDAKLTLQMASVDRLRAAFQDHGVGDNSRIVICFAGDWVSPAARVFVALDYLGLGDHTSVLDGGLAAWRADQRPIIKEVPVVPRGTLTPHPRPDAIVDAAWVASHLRDPRVAIIDARTHAFYAGEMAGNYPRQGHIAGAMSLPFNTVTEEASLRMKAEAALRSLFDAAGAMPGGDVVTYCHIGQQASQVYLAARLLGYRAHLYDGSFEEWAQRSDLPVETGSAARKP
jgi:thiosulfate/3-mercaptopyruvate sulfurtransferase